MTLGIKSKSLWGFGDRVWLTHAALFETRRIHVLFWMRVSPKTGSGHDAKFVVTDWAPAVVIMTLKTKGRKFENFVFIGDTVSCRNDNLQYHQWQQSCQIDDLLFSVW